MHLLKVAIAALLTFMSLDLPGDSAGQTPGKGVASGHKAGVARVVITPEVGVWMSGYGNRTKPAEGKVHELYAKALALEDAAGQRLVLITTDLVGLPRDVSEAVAQEIQRQTGLPRDRLMFTSSHTHYGPVIRGNLMDMFDLSSEHRGRIESYVKELKVRLAKVVADAIADLKPAQLAVGQGKARFAVNRRKPTEKGFANAANPDGPVDHDVPVLRVTSADGKLRAVVFGYACHNTTLQPPIPEFYQWCGDWAGFAQAFLEEKHAGAVALFWTGCGGDSNPLPRGTLELSKKYATELADAVEGVLKSDVTPIRGELRAAYAAISLPLGTLPTRDQLVADTLSNNRALKARATRLLKVLDEGGKLQDHYPHYPVQVWRLGEHVTWISLGGEVVVDYSHRLKKELATSPGSPPSQGGVVWVTAYANDVMAYIPSKRVLLEGGYEGESSMIYYGLPTKWAPEIEEKIVGKVHELARAGRK